MKPEQQKLLTTVLKQMSREDRLSLFYQLQFIENVHKVMDEFSLSQEEIARLLEVPKGKVRSFFSCAIPITVGDVARLSLVTSELSKKSKEDGTESNDNMSPSVSFNNIDTSS